MESHLHQTYWRRALVSRLLSAMPRAGPDLVPWWREGERQAEEEESE